MPTVPALWELRQDYKFKPSLGKLRALLRPCLKTVKKKAGGVNSPVLYTHTQKKNKVLNKNLGTQIQLSGSVAGLASTRS